MRIIFITDIHGATGAIDKLPEADLLLVGGDFVTLGDDCAVRSAVKEIEKRFPAFLGVSGNMDPATADAVLAEGRHLLPSSAPTIIDGLGMAGLGGANRSPFNTPNEWDDTQAARKLETLQENAVHILVTHAPPMGSGADRISSGANVGSAAIADAARRIKPALLLCGHIHEAAGIYRMGPTIIVNPGQFGDEGRYADIRWAQDGRPSVWLAKANTAG